MAGQLTKRGESWQVRIFLGRDTSGVKKFHTKTIRGTKREAEAYRTKILREMDLGNFVQPTRQTVAEFLDKWLQTKVNVRPRTLRDYQQLSHRYIQPAIGLVRLSQLTSTQVQALVNDLIGRGLSPRTVKYVFDVLKMALTHAYRTGEIARNPCDVVALPRQRRSAGQSLTPEQARNFLRVASADRYAALWLLLIETGARPGEALGLKWEDIDFTKGVLQVHRTLTRLDGQHWSLEDTKTELSRRPLYISDTLASALKRHRAAQNEQRLQSADYAAHGFVFASRSGQPLDYRVVIRRHFKPLLERAGIEKLRPYDLRHTSATLAIELGIPLKSVSERLGHSTVKQTLQTYQHILPNGQADAAKLFSDFLQSEPNLEAKAGAR